MYAQTRVNAPHLVAQELISEPMARLEMILRDVSDVEYSLVQDIVSGAFTSGGKRIRPTIALLAGKLVGAPEDRLMALAAAVETLHAATLVHDDLIDQSLVRRGRPTLNATLGIEITVLAGDYLFARSAEFAAQTESPRVVKIFSACLMTICGGELSQLADRRGVPAREQYFRRIYSKTAALFAAAAEGAAVLGGASEDTIAALRRYGENLGLAFQISDDMLDFTADEAVLGKPVGSDLRQGTVTLPVLYAASKNGIPLAEALAGDRAAVEAVIRQVRTGDALALAQADAEQYSSAALVELQRFPAGPARQALETLAAFSIHRPA